MTMRQWLGASLVGAVLSVAVAAAAAAGPTLDAVRSKGYVTCAVTTGLAGFSMPDRQGHYTGLDVDVCRAIAAAVLGNSEKTKFVPATAEQRFAVLQSGHMTTKQFLMHFKRKLKAEPGNRELVSQMLRRLAKQVNGLLELR